MGRIACSVWLYKYWPDPAKDKDAEHKWLVSAEIPNRAAWRAGSSPLESLRGTRVSPSRAGIAGPNHRTGVLLAVYQTALMSADDISDSGREDTAQKRESRVEMLRALGLVVLALLPAFKARGASMS
jgi:hypothetical protein